MKIIDAQVHLWSSGTPIEPHRPISQFDAGSLLAEMTEAGVNGAVIHPPTWDPASNQQAMAAVRQHPGRFSILGNFTLPDPVDPAVIDTWRQQPGMVGLRFALVHPHQQQWVRDGVLDWLWPAVERAGLPLATMPGAFLPEFRRIAERYPNLTLIVDHLGLVRRAKDEAAFAHLPELLALARLPNVYIKATGAPAYSSQPYPFANIHDNLHRIYDAFGPTRFFWGTDITRMACSYRQCVTMFTEELPWLQGEELELVMGQAFSDLLDHEAAARA